MTEKKLYRVQFVFEAVAVGTHEMDALCSYRNVFQRDIPTNACVETATPIRSLLDLPEGWSGESYPYGDDHKRRILDWLTTTKLLTVRGDPKQVATFLASMRGVAERMRVEIVDATPETTETEAPCES